MYRYDEFDAAVVRDRVAQFRTQVGRRLDGSLTETPAAEDNLFATETSLSLKDLVARLKKAKDDKNVPAAVLLLEGASVGSAQAEELRQAMAQFRQSRVGAAGTLARPVHA